MTCPTIRPRDGADPPEPDAAMAAAGAAMMRDPEVLREVIETIMCLALPQEVFARPGSADRIAKFSGETPIEFPGPSRMELLELLA